MVAYAEDPRVRGGRHHPFGMNRNRCTPSHRSTPPAGCGEDDAASDGESEGTWRTETGRKPSSIEAWLEERLARLPVRLGAAPARADLHRHGCGTAGCVGPGPHRLPPGPDAPCRAPRVTGEPPSVPDRRASSPLVVAAHRDRVGRRRARRAMPTSVFFLLNILLVATTPVVIARSLWRRQLIDIRTVLGAVCIYVLLGMMFAFVYAAIDGIGDDAVLRADRARHDTGLPLLQLHHPDDRRLRRLHRRRRSRPRSRGRRSADRPALPGDDHRGARQPLEWARADARIRRPPRRWTEDRTATS